ncbi:amino acid adenylation domain-containing protein [Pseudomonas xanthosomatis]|uniref:non-ribosomal peptide synthetase n=1 Tax=Pseudomonas xanthosomatis TaxID=2842356 RepID=UPI001C3E3DB2|nr:non-ribosomal peptide synthetase [Pseudomonas xanthosomatis]QXH44672.1 amino acid adenylation domain-containing protein [Pseudomonas xanthosomatis]
MPLSELMAVLCTRAIRLQRDGDDLVVLGADDALDDHLWQALADHKPALLAMLAGQGDDWVSPALRITPDMLPLVSLDQAAIDRIVATVPGGAANVQDIYPLAPLQEGMLYHHLSASAGDPYLLQAQLRFASAAHLAAFREALQWVIQRHDILRSALLWERLDEPLQVVWREAPLVCEGVLLDGAGDALAQLRERFDSRQFRLDLGQAPLLRLVHAPGHGEEVVALLLFHHTVMDHAALDIVRRELHAHLTGNSAQVGPAVPFRDLLAEARQARDAGAQQAFFGQMLGDIDEPTLAFGLAESDGLSVEEARLTLEPALSLRLRGLARQLGVSPASLMHLAMARVLGQVSGREAVVFGSVLLGRMEAGAGGEQALGMFINTLPLRVDVGAISVSEGLQTTHQRLSGLLGHEQASLAEAQRCSGVAAPTPLFNCVLNYRHSAAGDADAVIEVAPGILVLGAEERTNYPLTVNIDDLGEAFRITALVASQIGARRVAGYLAQTLGQLAQALEQAPHTPVQALDILPPGEREQLLQASNQPLQAFAATPLLHQRFEAHAKARPQATALIFEQQSISYGELNRRANQLAHHLIGLGIGPEARVAICVERGPAMIVAMLGVLKAGAGYVPIDPGAPAQRIAFTLADSAPAAVLSQADCLALLGTPEAPLLDLDDPRLASQPEHDPQCPGLLPTHLAYVIYTSGSTGLPKGVMVEHGNASRLFTATDAWYGFNPQDVWALFHSFAFDFSVWEIWGALAYGGQLLIVPQRISRNPDECYALLCQSGVSVLNQTPSAFRQLIAAQGRSTLQHSLRQVIFGGEALEPGSLKPWYARIANAGTRLVNMYGITETTVHVTYRPLQAADAQLVGVSPIGERIPDLQLYVLDAQRQPVPVGVTGELYVGGAGVARGYLNRPELSAERFISDPFNPAGRLYKTGDLARWAADGSLDYLGRNDDQVKIRGFRIELGEIEARLAACAGVREAVVLARPDSAGEPRLVAWWLAEEGAAPSVAELRQALLKDLAEYMVPAAFVRLDSFPLTGNGKLDRKALPEPDGAAFARHAFEAPQGEAEQCIAQIWQQLLGIAEVGRHDNFFELGGHSLLAVKLVERMRQQDLAADVRVLFGQPTLAALAAAVTTGQAAPVPANLVPAGCTRIEPHMLPLANLEQAAIDQLVAGIPGGCANVQDIYGLAPLQQGILYHHLASSGADPYVLRARFAFAGESQLQGFVEALDKVIAEHDILRTSIHWQGLDEAVQVVHRQARLPVVANADLQCLELNRAPLMKLVRHSEGERLEATLLLHHILLDHTATELLVAQVGAVLQGRTLALDSVPYRNYVARARLDADPAGDEALFRDMLGDIDEPTEVFGLRDVQGDGVQVLEHQQPVAPALAARLRVQARQLGVSIASLVHQAWGQVLAQLSGRQEVVFGTVLLGRLQGGAGADRALGMFINTLPLRVSVDAMGVADGVRRTHQRLAQLLGHEQASLAQALRCSGVPSDQALFTSLLNFRHASPKAAGDGLGWAGIELLASRERSNYPLVVNVDDQGEGLNLTVQAVPEVDGSQVCALLACALEQLAQALEQAPQSPLHAVASLPAGERERVLHQFNDTRRDYPREQPLHVLFQARAAASGDAVALIHGQRQWRYAELAEHAHRLAHHLLALGLRPGERVALLLPRSFDLVAAQLAVSRCGATYVPLDGNAPLERQAFMLEDCGASLLLTHSDQPRPGDTQRVELDTLNLAAYPGHAPELAVAAGSAAYIMYTSGSTGTPKGVQVPHRAVARLVINNGFADFNARDRVAFASNPAFDASTLEVWAPLLNGGAVVVIDQHQVLAPDSLGQALLDGGVTVLWLTAGLFHQYADALLPVFATLRYLMVGGDVLDPAVINRVLQGGAPGHLLNGYGPTEATTFSTTFEIHSAGAGAIPIGTPIGNSRCYVLDARRQPLPVGAVGELYIGGDGVALGYLGQPALTAERFIDDPFSGEPGARLYRSGDLVAWQADGTLRYLGRSDQQVKLRGFRIELGEIEARLAACTGVRDAVVLVREDVPGDKRLVAYFQAEGEAPAIASLHEQLQGQLPDYMLPAAYVGVARWPLTANGKLDRRALPAPGQGDVLSRVFAAPEGALETRLAAIWADLLKVERVGRHDNFFEMGGHSLLAVSLIERMRKAGLGADVRVLFAQPTLAALAAAVGSGSEVQVPVNRVPAGADSITPDMLSLVQLDPASIQRIVATVPGGAANVQEIYPLAPLQEGILYHHLSAAQGDPYLLQSRLAFDSLVRLQAWAAALQQVIARHDILRTSLAWEGLAEPVQVVWRHAELGVDEIVLDAGSSLPVIDQLQARFDARQHRIDLGQAPLLRLVYAHDPGNSQVVAILLFHHLALDHTAMDVVGSEMLALMRGDDSALSAPVPYRNYVAQARLGNDRQRHEAFFSKLLGDIDEPTLPFGLHDVQGEGHAIEEAHQALDGALARRLREQARQLGVSAASLAHLAWARVVGVLANRSDVVFGTVLMGRLQGGEGADRALGVFINTLPLRIDTCAPVAQALRATHAGLSALLGHEHAALAEAVRCSGLPAGQPLFSALLNYRHSNAEARRDGEGIWQGVRLLGGEERSNYPLTLSVDDLGEGFALSVLAQAGIGAGRVAGWMANALEQLVQALEQGGQAAVELLPLLGAEERVQLLEGFNDNHRHYPKGMTVHALIEAQAARAANARAVVQGEEVLTYGELNRAANRLAHHLIGLGVAPGARVALCLPRTPQRLVALLAVLKAGAAYVPVDPAYPAERIAYLLHDSAPALVLAESANTRLGEAVPRLNLDLGGWHTAPEHNPQVPGLADDGLAYVVYTSGSTGQPKGVMVEHRTLANLVHWHCEAFSLGAGSQTASVAGFGFDAMAWEVWPALCAGAVLHLPPAELAGDDVQGLLDWWQAAPLEVAFLPTPLAEQVLRKGQGHPTLRTLLTGGDRLRPFDSAPGFAVVNNYGPTETTVVATSGQVAPGTVAHIGRPLPNTRAYVLDGQQQPVPVGVAGELYIGGAGVARGYLGRPDLTAERFVDNPFHGGRMYRSGDLVRWNSDGTLDYLGRNDDQVKIRGMRVELGEVEAALSAQPGVAEAAVLVRGERLLAWFCAEGEVNVDELRQALAARLPAHMLPLAFMPLAALPLTTHGKLDRRALPDPDPASLAGPAFEAPQGERETAMAQVWAEVLGLERVGRHDNFFTLGGHSLLAVSLVEQLRSQGIECDVRQLFSQPSVAALAAAQGPARQVQVPANGIPAGCRQITPGMLSLVTLTPAQIARITASVSGGAANVQDIYPLAPLQEGILYHHLGAGRHDPYVLQSRMAFDSEARLQAFAEALRTVIARHDILRTAVLWEGLPQAVQVVWREAPLLVREQSEPAEQWLDLAQAPLIRLTYSRTQGSPRLLATLQFHHIVLDHTALEVVRAEMLACLNGQGEPAQAPVPYRNYVAQALLGVSEAEHEAFFRGQLADIDEPTLPYGLNPQAGVAGAIEEARLQLPEALQRQLRSQARQLGVSTASLLHLAFGRLLAAASGKACVVFGSVLLGRMGGGDGASHGLGMFINTLPLRLDLDGFDVRQAVRNTHERLSALLAHEHASLALAQRCSAVAAPQPLFSAMLNYRHGEAEGAAQREAWQGIETLASEERTHFLFSLNVDDFGDALRLTAQVPAKVGAARVCQQMQAVLEGLVQALERQPDLPVQRLNVVPVQERERLLLGFNATAAAYDLEQTVHGLIEAQVQRSPEAIAVRGEEGELSFAQLNAKANRLAHHLIALGVKPDDRVAICVERGLAMVVGLLAILKAGGAYVPVDPDYPAERINHMLTDSAPVAVLVHGATRQVPQGLPVVDLDLDTWTHLTDSNPVVLGLTPNHLAYVIYTSGSTGLPKGVMNEHRGVVNRLLWTQQQYQLGADDVVLQKTPFSFDVSVWEFFWPLQTGACLVMARPGGHKDPAYLRDVIAQQQVTTLHFVPSMLDAFLAHGDAERAAMKRVLCSGEALPGSLVRRFKAQLAGVELHNLYGPTEAAVDVSAWHCAEPLEQTPDNTPIGKPVANTQLYVLDAYGQPTPQGVAGELYIGGVQVARGYLNRAELSAERFIDDPFTPGGRLYRTGDLARHLADGNLEYLGRNDDQVKLRGLRIELGEIQACLTRIDGIQEAAVLAPELQGERRLVAYYTGNAQAVEELRAELLRHLPEFMVPALFVHLQALPLSPNGKLDRKALPVPGAEALTSRPYEAPQGATEQLLAEVWAELLGLERVGRHDNFFELGGHSLLAVTLTARLREHGLEADVRALFEQPTLAGYAAITDRMEIVL